MLKVKFWWNRGVYMKKKMIAILLILLLMTIWFGCQKQGTTKKEEGMDVEIDNYNTQIQDVNDDFNTSELDNLESDLDLI